VVKSRFQDLQGGHDFSKMQQQIDMIKVSAKHIASAAKVAMMGV
jgi:hypothetical protein